MRCIKEKEHRMYHAVKQECPCREEIAALLEEIAEKCPEMLFPYQPVPVVQPIPPSPQQQPAPWIMYPSGTSTGYPVERIWRIDSAGNMVEEDYLPPYGTFCSVSDNDEGININSCVSACDEYMQAQS